MRRIIFFIATVILFCFSGRAQTFYPWEYYDSITQVEWGPCDSLFERYDTLQYDTLQSYPYLYLYNWPDTARYHDETFCRYYCADSSPYDSYGSFALYQHTDEPLNIIGVAFMAGESLGHSTQMTLRIYDSAMNVLVCDTAWCRRPICQYNYESDNLFYNLDTNRFKIFSLPGKMPCPEDPLTEKIILRFKYFTSGKPIIVNGGFWIEICISVPFGDMSGNHYFLIEAHDAPYRINNVRFKIHNHNTNSWDEYSTDGLIPELFAIVAPECTDVEGVTVTEADGCVDVVWDSVEGQTQWQVFVQGPGVSQTDTVDVCHWHYCGYDTNAYYNVYVSSLCEGPQGWSEWSDAVHFGNPQPQTIATTAGTQFMLSPNPAAGQVTVTAEEGLRHIEVYDIRGALVYSAAADGTTAVVETKAWPTGQYVVTVETAAGKGCRVLTVAR